MAITVDEVTEIFKCLGSGRGAEFFEYVADDVCWTIMGTHPLAGTYHGKMEVLERTFKRLGQVLQEGVVLKINHVLVHENSAVVETEATSTARNGMPYHNTYCWVLTFHGDTITEVRAYVDSAAVQKLFDENEAPAPR